MWGDGGATATGNGWVCTFSGMGDGICGHTFRITSRCSGAALDATFRLPRSRIGLSLLVLLGTEARLERREGGVVRSHLSRCHTRRVSCVQEQGPHLLLDVGVGVLVPFLSARVSCGALYFVSA